MQAMEVLIALGYLPPCAIRSALITIRISFDVNQRQVV